MGKDRAQLIVIAGLLLAVLFVGLAVVVNSAIYTENVSTRESTSSANVIADDTESIERVGESLSHANYHSDTADFSERQGMVEDDLSEWDEQMGSGNARTGQAVGYENAGMTEGVRVSQDEPGEFMPADEDLAQELLDATIDPVGLADRKSWLVAPGVTTRAFEMKVERESLASPPDGPWDELTDFVDWVLTGSDDALSVEFDDGETVYRVYILDDSDEDAVAVFVTEGPSSDHEEEAFEDQTAVGECRIEADEATVQLSAGALAAGNEHEPCESLDFLNNISQYDVYYGGADQVNGTYRLIADKPEDEFRTEIDEKYDEFVLLELLLDPVCSLGSCDDSVYETTPVDGHPYTTTAVYDVSVNTTYTDDRIQHSRTVQVAPEAE